MSVESHNVLVPQGLVKLNLVLNLKKLSEKNKKQNKKTISSKTMRGSNRKNNTSGIRANMALT